MGDDEGRKRVSTSDPIPIPNLSPENLGRLVSQIASLRHQVKSQAATIDRLETMIDRGGEAVDRHRGENTQQIQNLRAEVASVADATRDITTTSRNVKWVVGFLVPMVIIGAISVIQSMSRQEQLEKSAETSEMKTLRVENRIQSIEYDVGLIKVEQQHARKTLDAVSSTLAEVRDGQARLEHAIGPRRRR